MTARQPAVFIAHGGGPCFFIPDPPGHWLAMGAFLRSIRGLLPEPPKAILVVSAHWESRGFRLTGSERPPLIYDYYGFPPETYALHYDAPGQPSLASAAVELLQQQGLPAEVDASRGFDHGVFVPLKVAFPEAQIPVVEMSVDGRLDPEMHLAAGRALASLRDEGVLIIGSGMSFHNLNAFGDKRITVMSKAFDAWLTATLSQPGSSRAGLLSTWAQAPAARVAHPTAEHLIPLMVAAGASEAPGRKVYADLVLEAAVSGFCFD